MGSVSTAAAVNLFKRVYGDLQDLLPEDFLIAKDIPFTEKQKVGEKYIEGVVLSHEVGITFGGSTMDAFELNPAIAGAVRQAEVATKCYEKNAPQTYGSRHTDYSYARVRVGRNRSSARTSP